MLFDDGIIWSVWPNSLQTKVMKVNLLVQHIDFDFDEDEDERITDEEQEKVCYTYEDKTYGIEVDEVSDIDDAICELITNLSGWCVAGIAYRIVSDDYHDGLRDRRIKFIKKTIKNPGS